MGLCTGVFDIKLNFQIKKIPMRYQFSVVLHKLENRYNYLICIKKKTSGNVLKNLRKKVAKL